jgi:AGZA family xanthine/uracil permease-like MFS transporter
MLNRLFDLQGRKTDIQTELVAGATTFFAMSYIIFVNPQILADAGMDRGAVFVATCLACAVGTLIMGLWANLPIAVAPGMGLNAYFTYGVVIGMGVPWQTALGAVFLSGVLFVILSLTPVREWIINAIPKDLKVAISAGVGLFLIIIGLRSFGVVVDNPATLVALGKLSTLPVLLGAVCFIMIGALEARKVPGSIILSILLVSALGVAIGISKFSGVIAPPPDVTPTFLKLDLSSAFTLSLVIVVLSLLFVDLFDTAGTLVGVSQRAGLIDANGKLPGMQRALLADSVANVFGAIVGTSSNTCYVESAAGVRAGGRTGLTSVVTALFFLAALFFAPLASAIQPYATGPALVFVGCVMLAGLAEVVWEDVTSFVPAAISAAAMPLTYSIATGVGLGFLSFTALKLLSGRWKDVSPGMIVLSILFLLKFIFESGGA